MDGSVKESSFASTCWGKHHFIMIKTQWFETLSDATQLAYMANCQICSMCVCAWVGTCTIVHECVSPLRRACTLKINVDYQSQLSLKGVKGRKEGKWWKGIKK